MKKSFLQPLSRRSEFKRVFDQGRKFPSRFLILFLLPNGLDHSRLGLAVSRKVGNAVTRNRVRRRIREIFRNLEAETQFHYDVVAVAKSIAPEAEYSDLENSIRRVFTGLKHEKTVHNDHQAL